MKKRINKNVWMFLIILVVQVLFDPLSPLLHFGQGVEAKLFMPHARRIWDAQEITHYTFDFKAYMPLACIVGGSVEVKDGLVIRTGPSSDAGMGPIPLLDPGFTTSEDFFL